MANNLYKCPFCSRKYIEKFALYDHMENEHKLDLCELPAAQVYFNYRNRYALTKGYGKSIISNKPTPFNLTTERYEKFADDNERQQYREMFKKRMKNKYGKDCLLNDPEQQKKMLAARKISGKYTFDDGTEFSYVGTYEKAFLEFLNLNYDWENASDIMAPAPMIIDYVDSKGKHRFHIPDFYIQSLNLIVNIKSGTNMGYRLRDIDDEYLEDEAIKKTDYNYIKILDNNFKQFIQAFDYLKKLDADETPKRIFITK